MSLTARLTLMQWLSPAFPTGAFAASHGFETYIAEATPPDAAGFGAWLCDVLRFGAGWQDTVLLALALRPGADYAALATLARALAPGRERLSETMDQGSAFARTTSAMLGRTIAPAPLPIALGEAAAGLDLPLTEVLALYLWSFAGNLTSVATRAIPLGQTEAQALLASLSPLVTEIATRAACAGLHDLGGAALAGDIASLRHETLDTRLYRT